MSDLISFLLARIAEDERRSHHQKRCPHVWSRGTTPCDCKKRRVMAECLAKRELVAEWDLSVREDDASRKMSLGPLLAAFAAIYADHPDYRKWRNL